MRQMPLSLRIVLLVVITSGVLVGGMLVTIYQLMITDYETLVAERESAEIERLSSNLDLSLQQRMLALEAFATRLLDDNGQLRSNQEIQALLKRPSQANTLFPDGLLIFDAHATALVESRYVPGRIGTNYADRPHVQRVIQSKSGAISEPIIGRTTGLPLLSFLEPVLSSNNDVLAFVGGILDLSRTPLLAADGSNETDSEIINLVLDPQHRMFVSMKERFDTPEPLPPEGSNSLVDAAVFGKPAGTVVEYQQQPYLIASQRLETLGWVALRAIPYRDAIAPAKESFQQFFLISLTAMLLVAMSGWWVARSLTQPLVRITRRINRMADDARFDSDFHERGSPEARALAQAMNRLARERKAVEQLKDDFLSSVSHELRTPLTSLHGGLKILHAGAAGDIPEQAKHLVELSLRNSERLRTLISDLLDFNRLASGNVHFHLSVCSLGLLAEKATADIATTANKANVHFSIVIPDNAWVHADETRLRQVLDNLLSNALKHSPESGVVTLTAIEIADQRWRLTVSDQGGGVPEDFKSRIFQRFAQAEHGNKRAATGTGLGLAISQALVQKMHGDIGFYNDKGAHFWFELPQASSSDKTSDGENQTA